MVKFATIYRIFKEKSSIIFGWNWHDNGPEEGTHYPTINTEKFNMTAVAMLADIVEFLVFDQSIREAGLNIHSNNQAALTFENYIECKKIVLNYIESQLEDEVIFVGYRLVPKNISSEAVEFWKLIAFYMEWIGLILFRRITKMIWLMLLLLSRFSSTCTWKEFLSGTVNKNYGDAGDHSVLKSNMQFRMLLQIRLHLEAFLLIDGKP